MKRLKRFFTAPRLIAVSFFLLILFGAGLLSLPISSKSREWTGFVDSLFTATSATCVTGLTVFDTFSYWSIFGQVVIILLIQIGGIGCMTLVSLVVILINGKITARDEKLLMQAAGVLNMSDTFKLVKKIIKFTLITELLGAIALSTQFVQEFGWIRGLYSSVFIAISAFCNAGFDLFGDKAIGSVSYFFDNPTVIITLSLLIFLGGLGFIVWNDVIRNKLKFKKYLLHTKIVLTMTIVLVIGGFTVFFFSEKSYAFAGMSLKERILSAIFQSVSPRTAGFYSVSQASLSQCGMFLTIVLMAIGGSPGSTAGGIKTTTIFVVMVSQFATARKNREITTFRYRINESTVREANSIVTIYLSLIIIATLVMTWIESLPIIHVLYEVVSAVATVGLTVGITPGLTTASHLILTALMFIGRIGGLTFAFMLSEKQSHPPISRPAGQILIG